MELDRGGSGAWGAGIIIDGRRMMSNGEGVACLVPCRRRSQVRLFCCKGDSLVIPFGGFPLFRTAVTILVMEFDVAS